MPVGKINLTHHEDGNLVPVIRERFVSFATQPLTAVVETGTPNAYDIAITSPI
jgi:hypothetical protein